MGVVIRMELCALFIHCSLHRRTPHTNTNNRRWKQQKALGLFGNPLIFHRLGVVESNNNKSLLVILLSRWISIVERKCDRGEWGASFNFIRNSFLFLLSPLEIISYSINGILIISSLRHWGKAANVSNKTSAIIRLECYDIYNILIALNNDTLCLCV